MAVFGISGVERSRFAARSLLLCAPCSWLLFPMVCFIYPCSINPDVVDAHLFGSRIRKT